MVSRNVTGTVLFLTAVILLIAGCTTTHSPAVVPDANGTTPAAAGASVAVPATTGSCIDNLTLCSGYCHDLRTDAANCGMCGIACPSGQACSGGVCTASASCTGDICPLPASSAGSTVTTTGAGTPAATTSAVPVPTAPGTATVTAAFVPVTATTAGMICAAGQTPCAGKCVNLSADLKNCGTCGNACPAKYYCSKGSCVAWSSLPSCAPGQAECSGICVDTSSDPGNCGSCGTTCVSGICSDGKCTLPTSAPTIAYTIAPGKGGISIP